MYEKYFLQEDSFKNVVENGETVGFQLGLKITYYRGLFLSMVEGFDVTIDGETFDSKDMTFTVKGKTFTFDEMEKEISLRWDFGEIALLTIKKPGGIALGEHTVEVAQKLRISYMPFSPVITKWEKTMSLA